MFDQYISLFNRAKIYEVKKLPKLLKQIANYVTGFIMKKETAHPNSKERSQAVILQENHKIISANILRIIAKFGLIKQIDQT